MFASKGTLSDDQHASAHNEAQSSGHGSARSIADGSAAEDVFVIPAKHPTNEALQRWKAATLALNATRRFRYTTKVAQEFREEELKAKHLDHLKRLRTSTCVVLAAKRFQKAGYFADKPFYDLEVEQLQSLVQERDRESLAKLGGIWGIAHKLQTDVSKGIKDNNQEIEKRREFFGANTYARQPPKGFLSFVWDAFKDLTLLILIACAILSLALGIRSHGIKEGWYDGVSIAVAVLIVILVTSISDYKQSLQFSALSNEKRNIQVQVMRGGRQMTVPIFDIVVGDLVVLNIGDQVPADGLFVDGHSLFLDESSMTGESEPVHIHQSMPYLMSGAKVGDGHGLMVVTGVGMMTEWGQLMAVLGDDISEETPLQVRLNGVATLVGKVGISVAGLVLIILIIFYFVGHTDGSGSSGKFKAGQTSVNTAVDTVVDIFTIAVTIVVVAVPEGLPLAVTLTLAYAMKKMITDKALVRRLSACETMGSATVICSDKTGTLTMNQMSVVKAWVAGELKEPVARVDSLHKEVYSLLLEGLAQNSNGSIFVDAAGGVPEVTGSPTEKAVLFWGLAIGMDFDLVKQQSIVLQVETFNSIKKRAGVAVEVNENKKVHVHWKGAAEIVLEECENFLCGDNTRVPITPEKRNQLLEVIDSMAAGSLRCIAFGFLELQLSEVPTAAELDEWEIPARPLTLISILGIKDPCRPEVPGAVAQCLNAGIKVRMITGDNILTAKAIATECGILKEGYAIEGAAFRNLSPEERIREISRMEVMARSSPSDKLLMVHTLRELGEVVAVTGDGTNDAPALKEADIGLAMGIQGTEVAKESADIIIMDDNFASVVRVVRWGRSVFLNIQKFIQFQLTVNVVALTVNFVAAVSSGSVPLTAVQLLWVNLIMDTLGALALATERPTNTLLQKPPIGRKEPLISNIMWRNIFSQALYQVFVLLVLQFKGKDILGLDGSNVDEVNRTIIFNAFVLCQLFNEVNARKLQECNVFEGLLTNWLFLSIIGASLILQVLMVQVLNRFASTVKLDLKYWAICIIVGFLSWPIAFMTKFIPVPKTPLMGRRLRLPWTQGRERVSRDSSLIG